MRKYILIIISIIIFITDTFSQNKEWFPFEVNDAISLGGGVSLIGNTPDIGGNINITIYGIYFDADIKSPKHRNDSRVGIWEDEKNMQVYHVGIQIPIISGLRFIPNIGYYRNDRGYTDGHDYSIYNGYIYNKFISTSFTEDFDYGCIMRYNIKHVNIDYKVNKHVMSISICIEIPCIPL